MQPGPHFKWAHVWIAIVLGVVLGVLSVSEGLAQPGQSHDPALPKSAHSVSSYIPKKIIVIERSDVISTAETVVNGDMGLALSCDNITGKRIPLNWIPSGVSLRLFPDWSTTTPLVICIYDIPVTRTPEIVSERFNQFFKNYPGTLAGYANVDLLIGAFPYMVEGSPLKMGGAAQPTQFTIQSAWGQIKLQRNGARTVGQTGDGKMVVVFDTYNATTMLPPYIEVVASDPSSMPDWHPTETYLYPSQCLVVPQPIPGHGPIVANLVHYVAPGADLRLKPVLNDWGYANLSDVLVGIAQEIEVAKTEERLTTTIFNFSWGVRSFPKPSDSQDIAALYTLLDAADGVGITSVAAAGNGSSIVSQPADSPADFPFVLSVAATHPTGDNLASYSNRPATGGVAAPGGDRSFDSYTCPSKDSTLGCDEQRCLVGMESDISYRYIQGTSFSAPQVTGLVALLKEKYPEMTPAQVRKQILETTTPDIGVINICRALEGVNCEEPDPNGLFLSGCSIAVHPGQEFTIQANASIRTQAVSGLGGTLKSDPDFAQPISATFEALFPPPPASIVGANIVNSQEGTWIWAQAMQRPQSAFSAVITQPVASIRYQATQPGTFFLTFTDATFADSDGFVLSKHVSGCWVHVSQSSPHDPPALYMPFVTH